MITNEQDLKVTHERIEQFQQWLVQVRRTARPEEFDAVASGYRLEIERMQAEVMEYLLHPPFTEPQLQPA
jgi:pyridoxal/pyridoxine/pyridoxamine kinase